MLTQTQGKQPQKFNHDDASSILSIIANAPLQNMQAAIGVQALMNRFALFVADKLGPTPPQTPAAEPAKPAGKGKGK